MKVLVLAAAVTVAMNVRAKEVRPDQEAFFHLRQSVAFVEAEGQGRCKDGFKLAGANLDESKRASALAKSTALSKWQDRVAEIVASGKASREELASLAKEIKSYGEKIEYKASKSWDVEVAKHCSAAPF